MAERRFQTRQALDTEVKEIFAKGTVSNVGGTAPAGTTTDLTAEITYTSATVGAARNADTITIQVEAAAANPTDTVLAVVSGTEDAVVITITPNDGTNNAAVAVDITTAEIAELVSTAAVVGLNVTLTDASSLLDDLSAVGGDTTVVVNSGEGDASAATLIGGAVGSIVLESGLGVESITKAAAGSWILNLEDAYVAMRSFQGIIQNVTVQDLKVQIKDQDVSSKSVEFFTVKTATATDPLVDSKILIKLEMKNSSKGE